MLKSMLSGFYIPPFPGLHSHALVGMVTGKGNFPPACHLLLFPFVLLRIHFLTVFSKLKISLIPFVFSVSGCFLNLKTWIQKGFKAQPKVWGLKYPAV